MKKKVFNTIITTLVIAFFLSACAEPRYYREHQQHSPRYEQRHHHTSDKDNNSHRDNDNDNHH
jgi:hypothetical protein